jgi:ribose 5-phosphate isomerase B
MNEKPALSIGCDHAGYQMKEKVKDYLVKNGYQIHDTMLVYQDELSYTEAAIKTCRYILQNEKTFGILICGTGIGMSIAANRIQGIRAALLYSDFVAEYARKHNDANVLVFGARTMAFDEILKRFAVFFSYDFAGEKYARRNKTLDNLNELV